MNCGVKCEESECRESRGLIHDVATSEKCESKTEKQKLGIVNFSVNLEKHGSDTGSGQEAGSRGSSHLRRLQVHVVRKGYEGSGPTDRSQLTKPAAEELVASPAALEAAEPAASVAELTAPDAELATLEAALDADSPTLEADSEASEAALDAEAEAEEPAPPTPKMVVAAEVVMVESPLVMVVAKDEVVMALEDSVAEPLSVAEPEVEPVAEAEPDCGCVRRQTCRLDGGGNLRRRWWEWRRQRLFVTKTLKSVFCPVEKGGGMHRWGAAHHLHWQ